MKKPLIKHTKRSYILLLFVGAVLVAAGVIATWLGFGSRLLSFGMGLGTASMGLGAVGLIALRAKPEDARQREIDDKDERYVKIREKSAYSTFFVTLAGLCAVVLAFVLLDYLIPCYFVIGLMALHIASYLGILAHHNKTF